MLFKDLIAVALGGAAGATGRHLTGILARTYLGDAFPWGTFLVNIIGCFLIGTAAGLLENREGAPWLFLVVGVLGGFTTFSAFGNETIDLIQKGNLSVAAVNIILQVAIGLAAVWGGLALTRNF